MVRNFTGTALAAALCSTGAMAFEVTGGDLTSRFGSVQYGYGSYGQHLAQAAMAFDLGGGLGAQAAITLGAYDSGNPYRVGEVHLTYAATPGLTLGAFVGKERFGSSYEADYFGVEANYVKDAFGLQAAILSEHARSGYDHRAMTLDATFQATPKISLLAGVHVLDPSNGSDHAIYYYAGGSYDVTPALRITATAGRTALYHETVVTLAVTYRFGGGAMFRQHGYDTLLPGD